MGLARPATSYQTASGVNGYGLHDMAGNVWEWCHDYYLSTYYSSSPASNPTGPTSGVGHILRGGGWSYTPRHCRCADRYDGYYPGTRYSRNGLRLALGSP